MSSVFSTGVSLLLLAFSASLQGAFCSLNDPHVFPAKTKPFMEGWYLRMTDADAQVTLGVVFGLSAPVDEAPPKGMKKNAGYLGIFFQDQEGGEKKLQVFNALIEKASSVYIYGEHDGEKIGVTKNPAVEGASNFKWCANSPEEGAIGCFVADPKEETLQMSFVVIDPKENKNVVLEALVKIEGAQWGAPGEKNYGPMGAWVQLPIPLVWYVHTTRARVVSYTYQETPRDGKFSTRQLERKEGEGVTDVRMDAVTGEVQKTDTYAHTLGAHGHLEKNWGKMFPEAWIWSQMYDAATENYFAVTYGKLDLPLPVKLKAPAHLIGFRNWKKNISLDFRPDNSHIVTQRVDGCKGTLELVVRQFLTGARFHLNIRAAPDSFSKQFPGPLKYGFSDICVESFSAVADVEVWMPDGESDIDMDGGDPDQPTPELKKNLKRVVKGTFKLAALEFGGTFQCNADKKMIGRLRGRMPDVVFQ
eukprot:GDKI01027514.1.p1 GENE.GDKI01027514.1~~GDKI01027514.1.p1  ORF type:complete len:474 (+),score=143.96 GDKI01027514.1:86-1507(+)